MMMLDAAHFTGITTVSAVHRGIMLPAVIRYQCFGQDESVRQILIFESNPSSPNTSRSKVDALVELADGRVFFFRTSLAVMRGGPEISSLFSELYKLPEWVTDWKRASEFVGYMIGAPLEFVDSAPSELGSWSIHEWKQQTASWLAINQPEMSIKQISEIISEGTVALSKELSIRLNDFTGSLDQFIFSCQSKFHGSWQSAYSYFTPGNERQRLYRRQAAKSFPMVIQHLFAHPGEESAASIMRAIDLGVPLVEHMASLFNCPKKCIRHLNGLLFEDVGEKWIGRFKEFLMIIGTLDVNRLPKSRHEWEIFGETVELLTSMTKMPTASSSSRLLLGELSKLNWNRRVDSAIGYQERALVIEQFSEHIRQAIVATAWVNGGEVCVAGGIAQRLAIESACALGLSRLERLARKWRSEELRLDSIGLSQQRGDFPTLLERPLKAGDMEILQLINCTQLIQEGSRMNTCVASYAGQCASGWAHIFSVRDMEGRSCVTVEYRLKRSNAGSPELSLVQQKGINNAAPDPRYYEALQVLHHYTRSPDVRKKLLDLIVYTRAMEKVGADMAVKYMRSLDFIRFLKRENIGKLDFEKLATEATRREESSELY